MEMICVTKENIDSEHICCSISDTKGEHGVFIDIPLTMVKRFLK